MAREGDPVNRLREMRKLRGISAAELGRRLRVDPSVIRHVEAGRAYAYPRLRRGVARVLGVDERELFGDQDTAPEKVRSGPAAER